MLAESGLKDFIIDFQTTSNKCSQIIATELRLPLEIEGIVEVPIKGVAVLNGAYSEEIVKSEIPDCTEVNAIVICE
jgi:hypothetical protein